MTEFDPPSPKSQNDGSVLPWYYRRRTILIGLLLGIWPGLILLALRPPRSKKKSLIIAGVVVGSLIVSSLGGLGSNNAPNSAHSNERATTTTSPPELSYKDFILTGVTTSDVWAASCTSIARVIRAKEKKYVALITSGKKFSQDPYSAQALIKSVSWWNSIAAFEDDVKNEVTIIISGTYSAFLSTAGLVATRSENGQAMAEEIDTDVIASCGLASSLSEVESKARTLAGLRTSLQYSANNVPWYPKGYSEFESGIAYRWLSSGQFSCSYSTGSCWGMSVRSKAGCNSLYVEITILDSQGNNIGYTNDTTSGLQPGQNAKMVFDSFEDNASKARLAKVSCY